MFNNITMMFKYLQLVLLVYSMNINDAAHLRPYEKLVRVQDPKEAKGHLFFLDFIGLARQYGYDAEQHNVTSEDGYIIEIFHILSTNLFSKVNGKPVVLLMPGFAATSDCFALFNRSLAYYLSDAGYDVWAGNNRGNTYGHNHIFLSDENPLFWNFTWHEMGTKDYPAQIDYILNRTKKSTLTMIGHSMGTTATVVLLSEKPEYNKKLNLFVALAPVVYWKNNNIIRLTIMTALNIMRSIIDSSGMSELFPQSAVTSRVLNDTCKQYDITDTCLSFSSILSGYNDNQLDKNELSSIAKYWPAGVSVKTLWHYAQVGASGGKFHKYNYEDNNTFYYGQNEPPDYKVNNIVTNIILFYGENDKFCTQEDVEELAKHVSSDAIVEPVNYPNFTHVDFILAIDIRKIFYNRLLELISHYAE